MSFQLFYEMVVSWSITLSREHSVWEYLSSLTLPSSHLHIYVAWLDPFGEKCCSIYESWDSELNSIFFIFSASALRISEYFLNLKTPDGFLFRWKNSQCGVKIWWVSWANLILQCKSKPELSCSLRYFIIGYEKASRSLVFAIDWCNKSGISP